MGSIHLTSMTADADLQLFDDAGLPLAASLNAGTASESIARTLAAGTYFAAVTQRDGATDYTLALAAS